MKKKKATALKEQLGLFLTEAKNDYNQSEPELVAQRPPKRKEESEKYELLGGMIKQLIRERAHIFY